MDLSCPKCKSDSTQKITAIVDNGTTHSTGRSSSVGIATTGRGFGVGSAVTTSSSVSKTALATKFARPKPKPKVYPIAGTIFLMLLVGWIPSSVVASILGGGTFAGLIGFLTFGGTSYLLFKFLAKKALAIKEYNTNLYPRLLHDWENGFFCHRCEAVFVPQL